MATSKITPAVDVPENPYLRDPDVQLMLRSRDGDDEAFAELVRAYQDRLINVLAHLVHDSEVAEDLAQDVFLRVYRARHGYQPTAKFATWLFRIANNVASNIRRDRIRKKEYQFTGSDSGPLGTRAEEQLLAEKSALMPARQVDKSELQKVVREAVMTLNERQRMAVLLNKFEEMSYADIGEALEMSPSAVKSLLSRARENLRTALEEYVR